ncbi:TIM barrel protein [Micrococcales bacterium 31B]|nr:TIM barrel protein [Micrococcales bacterium 31B]
MQLVASTLGAPGWGLEAVIAALAPHEQVALELRHGAGELSAPETTRRELAERRARLAEAGLTVAGLASYVRVAADADLTLILGAGVQAINAAEAWGATYVRVFPGAPTAESDFHEVPATLEPREAVNVRAAGVLEKLARYAAGAGVSVCLETHDSHPRGADVLDVLRRVDAPQGSFGAVWDVMHPYRVGEPLRDTLAALGPFLRHGSLQVKDAPLPQSRVPTLLGAGTVPLDEFAALLRESGGTARTLCLESEKAWHSGAPEFDVAVADFASWAARVRLSSIEK